MWKAFGTTSRIFSGKPKKIASGLQVSQRRSNLEGTVSGNTLRQPFRIIAG